MAGIIPREIRREHVARRDRLRRSRSRVRDGRAPTIVRHSSGDFLLAPIVPSSSRTRPRLKGFAIRNSKRTLASGNYSESWRAKGLLDCTLGSPRCKLLAKKGRGKRRSEEKAKRMQAIGGFAMARSIRGGKTAAPFGSRRVGSGANGSQGEKGRVNGR